jgi:hypothetical protein
MVRYPYIIVVSRGSHTHHPPPPSRLPEEIKEDIIEVLQTIPNLLDTTARKFCIYSTYTEHMLILYYIERFLLSTECQQLKEKWHIQGEGPLHPSLNSKDRLVALIRKTNLFKYPLGRHIAGMP